MTKTVRKKQYKGLRGVLTACIALALVLCGGMLMQSLTSANACELCGEDMYDLNRAGYVISWDGESAAGFVKNIYIVGAKPANVFDIADKQITSGASPFDMTTWYRNGTLKYGTVYYAIGFEHNIESWDIYNHTNILGFCINEGDSLPLPETPVREGHTFVGWYLDEALTQPYQGTPITTETRLYAKFEINVHTITYDLAGGAFTVGTDKPATAEWGTSVTLPEVMRIGYDFLGWYDGDVKYEGGPIKKDTTFTARWQIQTFNVLFMVDGQLYKTVSVEYGQSFEVAVQVADMAYYNLYDANGEKLGRADVVTENVTVNAAVMTQEEKIATWIGNNWWALIAGGVLVGVLGIALAVAIIVARKRR